MTSTQDSGIANDDQSESTSSDAFSCNNVIESHEIEQVDDELSPNVCESENNVNYCMQDSGLEVSEVAQTDDLNNNYHQLDQQLYRHLSSTPNLSNENANICSITSAKDCDKKEVISEKKKNENDQKVSSSKQKKVKRKGKPFMLLYDDRRALIEPFSDELHIQPNYNFQVRSIILAYTVS